jgi:tRNA threonylcarbamoyl adenosine modification protein YeaZ
LASDPLILAFDTSAAHCAVALLRGTQTLAQNHRPMQKGQAENLFPLLEQTLAQGQARWQDLDLIGVGTGPGNFTGIRISVSAARGLALSLEIPAIGVSALEARAFGHDRPVISLVDARRDHVYFQSSGLSSDDTPVLISAESAAQKAQETGIPTTGPLDMPPRIPVAVAIANIARNRFGAGTPPRPAPLYIRPADAAPPRDTAPTILP